MKKILIPTDFSDNSKNAIRYALELFKEKPCHFFIMYVNIEGSDFIEKPLYKFGTNVVIEKKPKNLAIKLKELKDFMASISTAKTQHHFTTISERGHFLKSIRQQILEKEIELIVMGTKGASELKEFFMGTRSGDVITKVACDVLVVPEGAIFNDFAQVVFPVDFEVTYDDNTLKKMARLITSGKTPIKLLYVTKSQISLLKQVKLQRELLLQRIEAILPNPISFHRVVSKKVEEGILIFTKSVHADLIIMISKDYGLLQKLFLDTTVEEVSFDTTIPLLSLQG